MNLSYPWRKHRNLELINEYKKLQNRSNLLGCPM
jgi:hypothetical protein